MQNQIKTIEFNTIRKIEMELNFKAGWDKTWRSFLANIRNSRAQSQAIHSLFHRRYQ